MRVGFGYDVHPWAEGRPLILGGVRIPHEKGLAGHSDADALLHAVIDALLGAAALGDIGQHFPDSSPMYANFSSLLFLKEVAALLQRHGYRPVNIDATLVLERPKIAPYVEQMRKNIAEGLQLDVGAVSVKATTSEKMGFIGREEGMAAFAVALIEQTP